MNEFGSVSAAEAIQAIKKLAQAAAKVPFPNGTDLRSILLSAYRREWGVLRFLHLGWWRVFVGK